MYINIYIYIYKRRELPQFLCKNEKKTVLESLKDFLQNVQNIFFPCSFSLSIENEQKNDPPPLCSPFWGVLVPLTP